MYEASRRLFSSPQVNPEWQLAPPFGQLPLGKTWTLAIALRWRMLTSSGHVHYIGSILERLVEIADATSYVLVTGNGEWYQRLKMSID